MTIRTDQIVELEDIQEKLVDVLTREADPASWVRDMDVKTTKLRLEQKRNAAATLTIITKISSVLNYIRDGTNPDKEEDEGGEPTRAELHAARNEAHKILMGALAKR